MTNTYWIDCPKDDFEHSKYATFRKWLLDEAADDTRDLRKMFASRPA